MFVIKNIMKKIFTITILFFAFLGFAQLPELQWNRTFGSIADDYITGNVINNLGEVFIVGNFSGTVDFDPGVGVVNFTAVGYSSIFIQKFNVAGDLLWAKKIDNNTNQSSPYCFLDPTGNLIVTASFMNTADLNPNDGVANFTSTSQLDPFMIKLDTNGNYLGGKNLTTASTKSEYISHIKFDAAGNMYILGYFYGTFTIDGTTLVSGGEYDTFIQKLDATGNVLWTKSFGGPSYDGAGVLLLKSDGSIYIAGLYGGTVDFNPGAGVYNLVSLGMYNGFILKLNSSGDFVWAKTMGSTSLDMFSDMEFDSAGNIVGLINFYSDSLTFSVQGVNQTLNRFPGDTYFSDAIVFKMDDSGNYLWVKKYGGNGDDIAGGIELDQNDKIYILGRFSGTADFDPGLGSNLVTSSGDYDLYLQCLSNSGNYEYTFKIGGALLDTYQSLILKNGSLYICGTFQSTVNMNPTGINPLNITSNGGYDYFISKFNTNSLDAIAFTNKLNVKLFPNPSKGTFMLEGANLNNATITIFDSLGKKVSNHNFNGSELNTNLMPGLYFVEIISNDKREVKKLVIQ